MVDLNIDNSIQTLDGTHTYDYINITNGGILYVTPYNGTGSTGRLVLNATEINIDSTSSINGFARGYGGGSAGQTACSGSCNYGGYGGQPQSPGYGGGVAGGGNVDCSGGGGGGGYGTSGGAGGCGSFNGSCYVGGGTGGTTDGTLDGYDIRMGSGAGGGGGFSMVGTAQGGSAGGAALTINAPNINIQGTLNFSGGPGGNGAVYTIKNGGGGGGASGGGILLNGTNVNISGGLLFANGGSGGVGQYAINRGANGGGGRIKIFCSGTYNASGATIQAGTTYVQLPQGNIANLTMNGGSLTLDGTHTYDYVNIINGGILYVTPYNGTGTTGRLILNVTEINVDNTSSIIGFKRGYPGGYLGGGGGNCLNTYTYSAQLIGYGAGLGSGRQSWGGGGYGTAGGTSGGHGNAGGTIQGTTNGLDIQMGNGGGAGYTSTCADGVNGGGEPGGGMLTINASQNINIHGRVNFDGGIGGFGSYGGGGASGGGILFNATNINLSSANITANGGLGGSGFYTGGTGGGGRIKIFYSGTYNNSGAIITAGTVYTEAVTPPTGSLNISSTPSGARIYIDNIDQLIDTPNTISDITTGSHSIKLILTNYNDYTTTVTIDPGQTTTITPTLTLSSGITKIQASPSFTQPSYTGEIIDLGIIKIDWNGTGTVILEKTIVYDRLVLTGPNGIFDHTWTPCGSIVPEGPFDITNIFSQGYNEINVKIYNICGGNIGTVTGSIDITGPITLSCPITPKYSGDAVTLQATPKDGIGPYYVEFSKDGVLIDPARLGGTNPGTSQIYNAPENTTITRIYSLTDEDVRNALTGTITFSVFMSDSCPTVAKTCSQDCVINIGCMPPVCNFTVT